MNSIKLTISIGLALLLGLEPSESLAQTRQPKCVTDFENVTQRIFLGPDRRFALMTFNEHALGTYVGVIYYGHMGEPTPVGSSWALDSRFWQDSKWASDVTGFCWSPDGEYLYISTAAIYGEGELFELDLLHRRSAVLFPTRGDSFYDLAKKYGALIRIVRLDTATHRLYFTATTLGAKSKTKVSRHVAVK